MTLFIRLIQVCGTIIRNVLEGEVSVTYGGWGAQKNRITVASRYHLFVLRGTTETNSF